MKKQDIQKWIDNAKPNESIIYYTGHIAEERDKIEVREMANTFMEAAQQKKLHYLRKQNQRKSTIMQILKVVA